MVKQTRPGMHYWDLPGGKLVYGETLEQTVIREVKEETQLEISVGRLAGIWQFYSPTNKHQVICPTYICTTGNDAVDTSQNVADEYIEGYEWTPKQDILDGRYNLLDESLLQLIKML